MAELSQTTYFSWHSQDATLMFIFHTILIQEYPQKVGSIVFCFGKALKSLEKTPSCSRGQDMPGINTKKCVSHLISAPSSTWSVMQFWGVKTGMNNTKKTETYNQSFTTTFDQDPNSSPDIKDLVCQPAWPGAATAAHCRSCFFLVIKTEVEISCQHFTLHQVCAPFRKFLLIKRQPGKLFSKSVVRSLIDLPVTHSND